jgi:CheY-like chemotaxis protein
MGNDLKVLVVDDEEAIVAGLAYRLRSVGYEPIAATGGDQALELALQAAPRLILLDWRMPGTDGMEVLSALKGQERTSKIPVVLLSGADADRDLALAAGAAAFIKKPYRKEELLRVIADILRDCAATAG